MSSANYSSENSVLLLCVQQFQISRPKKLKWKWFHCSIWIEMQFQHWTMFYWATFPGFSRHRRSLNRGSYSHSEKQIFSFDTTKITTAICEKTETRASIFHPARGQRLQHCRVSSRMLANLWRLQATCKNGICKFCKNPLFADPLGNVQENSPGLFVLNRKVTETQNPQNPTSGIVSGIHFRLRLRPLRTRYESPLHHNKWANVQRSSQQTGFCQWTSRGFLVYVIRSAVVDPVLMRQRLRLSQ